MSYNSISVHNRVTKDVSLTILNKIRGDFLLLGKITAYKGVRLELNSRLGISTLEKGKKTENFLQRIHIIA